MTTSTLSPSITALLDAADDFLLGEGIPGLPRGNNT